MDCTPSSTPGLKITGVNSPVISQRHSGNRCLVLQQWVGCVVPQVKNAEKLKRKKMLRCVSRMQCSLSLRIARNRRERGHSVVEFSIWEEGMKWESVTARGLKRWCWGWRRDRTSARWRQSVKRKKTRSINLFSTTDPIHVAVSTTEPLTDLQ